MPYKGRCDKEVEIFEEHFCGTKKPTKSKSGDGLSDCKPKWKYYGIMSFIDITLLKQRYVPIYLTTSLTYIQHIYNRQLHMILIRSI